MGPVDKDLDLAVHALSNLADFGDAQLPCQHDAGKSHRRQQLRAADVVDRHLGGGVEAQRGTALLHRPDHRRVLHDHRVGGGLADQREGIPQDLLNEIDQAVELSKNNDRLILSVALNYGSRNELKHAVQRMIADGLKPEEITEQKISEYLFTAGIPDPDLVIRTSGEQRLSNFLLYQSAYAEWEFPETLWPDFGKEELLQAIYEYSKRDRRFGKV